MALTLMLITNDPSVALLAESYDVDRIWIDLETKGKDQRQKNMNTVKSHHTITDVARMSSILTKAELMVRINPWDDHSVDEIEAVISAGADRIMLPMWKTEKEVSSFLAAVNQRVSTTLLLETKEAVSCLDSVLDNPLIEEIHIGLNDLHLSYGLTFMFELLTNGTVESLCRKMAAKGISYGFGGIAGIGKGLLPAERILSEHIRLHSRMVILSRSFFDFSSYSDADQLSSDFYLEIKKLRKKEREIASYTPEQLASLRKETADIIDSIASHIRKG